MVLSWKVILCTRPPGSSRCSPNVCFRTWWGKWNCGHLVSLRGKVEKGILSLGGTPTHPHLKRQQNCTFVDVVCIMLTNAYYCRCQYHLTLWSEINANGTFRRKCVCQVLYLRGGQDAGCKAEKYKSRNSSYRLISHLQHQAHQEHFLQNQNQTSFSPQPFTFREAVKYVENSFFFKQFHPHPSNEIRFQKKKNQPKMMMMIVITVMMMMSSRVRDGC